MKIEFENFVKSQNVDAAKAKTPAVFDDMTFKSDADALKAKELKKAETFCGWIFKLPDPSATFITALCFGYLGGVLGVFKRTQMENLPLDLNSTWRPMFSMLSGILVLGLTYILPTVLSSGQAEPRPMTLMFLCLFAGVYNTEFYAWVQSKITTVFKL